MRTTHDVEETLFAVLKPSIGALITGQVYLRERPFAGKEDIVINTLPLSGDQVQACTANVNLHVPMISVTISGQTVKRPDTQRSKVLTQAALAVLEDYAASHRYFVTRQQDIRDPATGEYYTNIRVDFQFFP